MAPRPITAQVLTDIFTGFQTTFQRGFAGVTPTWSQIATRVASTTKTEKYGWIGAWPKIREWLGDRHVNELSASDYSITNRKFESTVSVDRDDVEDDMPDGTIYTDLANNSEARALLGWAESSVPEVVSRMQLRRQLLLEEGTDGEESAGKLLDQVDAGIAASGDLDLIEYWANTSEFHRHHPKVEAMLVVFHVSADRADNVWTSSSALT